MRVIGMFIILFCSILSSSVAVASDERPSVLKIGYNSELPPFSYQDQQQQPAGFTVDLMNEIGANTGIEIIYMPVREANLLTQLKTGEVDVILGIKYSTTYEEYANFTDSIFTMSDSLYTSADNNAIFSLSDLKDSVVAISSGSSSMETLNHIRGVKVNVAKSQPNALDMFLLGRSDAYIGNPWTMQFLLDERSIKEDFQERVTAIQSYELSFAVSKDQVELVNLLNAELINLKKDFTFQEIHRKWFNQYKQQETWLQYLATILGVLIFIATLIILIGYLWNKRLKEEVEKKTTALSRSFVFQEQVLNSVDTGIISFHKKGKIRLMNEKAQAMLQGDFTNQYMEDVEHLRDLWQMIKLHPFQKKHIGDRKFYSENGEECIIHYEVVPLKNEMSRSVGWIITLTDITDQKVLQNKLMVQEKLKALGQLTAGIAHELRNPLTSMKLFIELLPVKIHDSRFRDELIKHVPAEINRLNALVEDLLDYTRKKEPITEWVSFNELIESLIYSFKIKVQEQGIDFNLQIDKELEWYCDKHRIKQVFINLLMNAIEAVQECEEKVITITTKIDESYFYVSIKDTGTGISEEEQANLFEPFFTTKGTGVGLGLYTSYNIVLDHQGDIRVQSIKGIGSTFTLKFRKEDVR